jgi:hypothetical protein
MIYEKWYIVFVFDEQDELSVENKDQKFSHDEPNSSSEQSNSDTNESSSPDSINSDSFINDDSTYSDASSEIGSKKRVKRKFSFHSDDEQEDTCLSNNKVKFSIK